MPDLWKYASQRASRKGSASAGRANCRVSEPGPEEAPPRQQTRVRANWALTERDSEGGRLPLGPEQAARRAGNFRATAGGIVRLAQCEVALRRAPCDGRGSASPGSGNTPPPLWQRLAAVAAGRAAGGAKPPARV